MLGGRAREEAGPPRRRSAECRAIGLAPHPEGKLLKLLSWSWLSARIDPRSPAVATYILPALIINVGNAAAYLFQMVLGRFLSLEAFSSFAALFSSVLIFSAPANFIVFVVTQVAISIGRDPPRERVLLDRALIFATGFGIVLAVLAALFMLFASAQLGMEPSVLVAALATIVSSCIHPVIIGFAQARRDYVGAALIQGGNPILRFVGGVLAAALGAGVAGAMWSVAIPVILTMAFGLYLLRDLWHVAPGLLSTETYAFLRRTTLRQMLVGTLLILLSNVDVLVARLVLANDIAGLYSAAAVISRVALLLPTAVTGIIFSEAVHGGKNGGDDHHRGLLLALIATAGLAAAAGLAFIVAADPVMTLLLGSKFAPAAGLLRLTGAAMAMLSISQVIVMTLVGRGDFGLLAALAIGVGLQVLVPQALPRTGEMVGWAMVAAQSLVLVACVSRLIWRWRRID